ncbi:MAG: branched-chain amino acid ABC transporter permease [Vallitaleaceae bacterium]|jgi:branched-chain amino acid transport system permease protein|nr:branched-chain amino acid ABC transporter permease [Vallitaleaceae bacterium]
MKKRVEYLITTGGLTVLYLVIMLLIVVGVLNGYYVGVIIAIGINIIVASSLNLATGFLGQLALGHAGFMAIGAYGAAHLGKYLMAVLVMPDFIKGIIVLVSCLLFGGILAAIAGLLIGIPSLRLRGDYLGIVTLGFGEIIRISIFNIEAIGGARTVLGIPKLVGITQIFILVAIVLAALYLLVRSRHGRAIISIREDEIAAEAVGVPTTFYKVYGFAISAFFAGIAGGTLAFYQGLIDPKKFTFMFSVEIFIIVVLGGMGSFTGTVIAAILLGVMNELLHAVDNWRMVIYAVVLIAMMIFRPKGLMGTYEFSLVKVVKDYIAKRKNQKTT